MNLLQVLLHPDREEAEFKERAVVVRAANLLQVGEFQLLQLAYRAWHGEDLPEAMVSALFSSYMLDNDVPPWARFYAREILAKDSRGDLDDGEPAFHRYDHDYRTSVPHGTRRFLCAVAVLVFFVGGGIWYADTATQPSATMFPPYFGEKELMAPSRDSWGRSDYLPTDVERDLKRRR